MHIKVGMEYCIIKRKKASVANGVVIICVCFVHTLHGFNTSFFIVTLPSFVESIVNNL
jgi:hypothetical protein